MATFEGDTYDCSSWDEWPLKKTRPGVGWKRVYRLLPNTRGMPVEEILALFQSAAAGLERVVVDGGRVLGWAPMSEEEKAAAVKRAAAAKKARAKRIERERAADLRKIADLAKKHGLTELPCEEG